MLSFELHSLGAEFVVSFFVVIYDLCFLFLGVVSLWTLVGLFCLGTHGVSTFINNALRA